MPEQSVVPAGHAHAPVAHVLPPLQLDDPQHFAFTQKPDAYCAFDEHDWPLLALHAPPVQAWAAPQAFPQLPQLPGVLSETQLPEQQP